ncbi:MAG TPA: MFS transporter [Parvibaculum sp.]
MAFFRNTTINLLNLHYWIKAVAMTGGGAFFGIYLLKSGVTIPGVLTSVALILLGRFFIRPLIVRIAVRYGLRAMIVGGTLFGALQYPLLAEVHGVGWFLAAVIVVSSIGDTVYWTTYHAYFAALGDDEHRGQQIGVREAVVAVIGVVSPLLAGWMLIAFGPRTAFGVTMVVAMLSALPVFRIRDVKVAPHVPGAFRAALPGVALFTADGWIAAGYVFVWQIALFTSLDRNFMAYGGALALAALFGAAGSLTLGRHIDAGHGKRAVFLAFGTFAVIVVLRAIATGNATVAVLANALGSLGACLYVPTLMTAVYTQAKRAPCPLRFHVATEAGWDIGGATGLLCAALLSALGAPLWVGILMSLAGVAANTVMLRRYYPAGSLASPGLTYPSA